MSNLSFFAHDFGGHQVRATADGRFSVFDILVAFGVCDKPNCQKVLKRIQDKYSEVNTFWINFKFPGKGQRNTPVATEEGIYQILMLCPGKRGAEFRKWASGIIADPDKALDHAVRKYKRMGWTDKQIKARLDGKVSRYKLTETLKDHGLSQPQEYARCTNAVNVGLFGQTAKQIQSSRKVKVTRDGLDDLELAALNLAELKAGRTIENEKAWGVDHCEGICSEVAQKVKSILD
jgi:DNA-damage-inducible protein D